MSGYQALRPSEDGYSSGPVPEISPWDASESDAPVVLARVADFTCEPELDVEPLIDAEAADPPVVETCVMTPNSPVRSRLAIGSMVLVAGLCGFLLGRVTSPNSPRDPDSWRPAPSASEAPTWNSGPVATSESRPLEPARPAVAAPAPWTAAAPGESASSPSGKSEPKWPSAPPRVAVDEPGVSERPAVPPAQRAAASTQPRWTANQGTALPDTRSAGQAGRGEGNREPYEAARLARRPDRPTGPNTHPSVQSPRPVTQPPMGQPPAMQNGYPSGGDRTSAGPTAAPYYRPTANPSSVPAATGPYPNGNATTPGYGSQYQPTGPRGEVRGYYPAQPVTQPSGSVYPN